MSEDKIIIKGIFEKNKIAQIMLIVSIVAFICALLFSYFAFNNLEKYFYLGYGYGGTWHYCVGYDNDFMTYFTGEFFSVRLLYGYILIISIIVFIIALIMKKTTEGGELTVTESRAYGKVGGGAAVDIPINQITRIAPLPNGAEIFTIVGGNKFPLLKNKNDVLNAIQFLLSSIHRGASQTETNISATANYSEAGALKQLKELLDSGVISQEDYNAKKKKILGL